jgi:hypothetical protein
VILRLEPAIPLNTPKGYALAHFLQDMGDERDLVWICFHEDGQIWSWSNEDVRACKNMTLARTKPELPKRIDPLAVPLADGRRGSLRGR